MARLGLALICGVSLAVACGNADDDSDGTGGASSGGSSATGGARASGGTPASGGTAGRGGSGAQSGGSSTGGASAGGKASGGSVADAGNAGSTSVAGEGGASSVAGAAGAAGDAGSGAGPTDGGAAGAGSAEGGASGMGGAGGGPDECPPALPLKCGDSFDHSTLIQGRPNEWGTYSATQRGEWGRETIYQFSTAGECAVVARLKNLTTDLDLIRVPTCNPISGDKASSTPLDIQTIETLSWTNPAGKAFYVVVDGYDGAEGSYTLEVECTCN